MVYYLAGCQRTYGSANTIGHHHEQALSRSLDAGFALLIDEDTTRHIEEVEGHTVNDAREDEHDNTWHSGVTNTEESETEHPGEHRHEHYNLDAITLQEEWDHEDTQGLANLRDTGKQGGIVSGKRTGYGCIGTTLKAGNERTGIAIGYLQAHAQQGREDKEQGHVAALEQLEGIEAKALDERNLLLHHHLTLGQCEAIEAEHNAENA